MLSAPLIAAITLFLCFANMVTACKTGDEDDKCSGTGSVYYQNRITNEIVKQVVCFYGSTLSCNVDIPDCQDGKRSPDESCLNCCQRHYMNPFSPTDTMHKHTPFFNVRHLKNLKKCSCYKGLP